MFVLAGRDREIRPRGASRGHGRYEARLQRLSTVAVCAGSVVAGKAIGASTGSATGDSATDALAEGWAAAVPAVEQKPASRDIVPTRGVLGQGGTVLDACLAHVGAIVKDTSGLTPLQHIIGVDPRLPGGQQMPSDDANSAPSFPPQKSSSSIVETVNSDTSIGQSSPVAVVEAPASFVEAPASFVEAPVAEAPVAEAPVAEAPVAEAPVAAVVEAPPAIVEAPPADDTPPVPGARRVRDYHAIFTDPDSFRSVVRSHNSLESFFDHYEPLFSNMAIFKVIMGLPERKRQEIRTAIAATLPHREDTIAYLVEASDWDADERKVRQDYSSGSHGKSGMFGMAFQWLLNTIYGRDVLQQAVQLAKERQLVLKRLNEMGLTEADVPAEQVEAFLIKRSQETQPFKGASFDPFSKTPIDWKAVDTLSNPSIIDVKTAAQLTGKKLEDLETKAAT